jgi:hypothetical protein
LSVSKAFNDAINNIHFFLNNFNILGDSSALGQFQSLMDDFKVELKILSVGNALQRKRNKLLDLLGIVDIS